MSPVSVPGVCVWVDGCVGGWVCVWMGVCVDGCVCGCVCVYMCVCVYLPRSLQLYSECINSANLISLLCFLLIQLLVFLLSQTLEFFALG